jgi:hypothetical protein
MRTLLVAAIAAVSLPAALSAQADPQTDPAPDSATEANAQAAPAPPTTTIEPGTLPGEPTVVVTTYPGNLTPPPVASLDKTYPVCRWEVQDNCQNPGEGGAPGRSRALGYWPGEPASERTDRGG